MNGAALPAFISNTWAKRMLSPVVEHVTAEHDHSIAVLEERVRCDDERLPGADHSSCDEYLFGQEGERWPLAGGVGGDEGGGDLVWAGPGDVGDGAESFEESDECGGWVGLMAEESVAGASG